jgi:hypothetical protein
MGPLTRTGINLLLNKNVNAARIDQALALLVDAGLAFQHTEQGEGRPLEIWTAIG